MKKSVVRKLVLLIGFSLLAAQVFAGSYYEGTGLEGKCFLAEEPVLSGYTGTTGNALITSLQSEIKNAFPQYTGMKLCTSNSEPADYIIMTVVQQNGNGSFLLTMTIMDPFTEATISCSIKNILKENDVYQHALANALLQLVPKLGIKLTSEGLSNFRSLGKIPTASTTDTAGKKNANTKQAAGTEKSSKNSTAFSVKDILVEPSIGVFQVIHGNSILSLDAGFSYDIGRFNIYAGTSYVQDVYIGITDEVNFFCDINNDLRVGIGLGAGVEFIDAFIGFSYAGDLFVIYDTYDFAPIKLKLKYQNIPGIYMPNEKFFLIYKYLR